MEGRDAEQREEFLRYIEGNDSGPGSIGNHEAELAEMRAAMGFTGERSRVEVEASAPAPDPMRGVLMMVGEETTVEEVEKLNQRQGPVLRDVEAEEQIARIKPNS